jgi:hypothetical protein
MPKAKKTKEHMYNAQGAPEAGEAMDETPGFKKGGVAKKKKDHEKLKKGGMVEGEMEKMRADKKSRGGKAHKRAAGGRTPYTSGHVTTDASSLGDKDNGHESERP